MPPEFAATILGVIAIIAGAVGLRFSDKASLKEGVSIGIMLAGVMAVLSGQAFVWWKIISATYA